METNTLMKEERKLTKDGVLKLFEESCAKLEKWFELNSDDSFDIVDNPQKELDAFKQECNNEAIIRRFDEENDGLATYKDVVQIFENQILYNNIVDNADAIYGDVLMSAKLIAENFNEYNLDKEKFLVRVYNMGLFKSEIDDEKELCDEFSDEEESVFKKPEKKVEAILDDEEIEKFLFG